MLIMHKQSYHTYAFMLIMHINKVIILMRYHSYYAYKQSYHTYALLCLLCV